MINWKKIAKILFSRIRLQADLYEAEIKRYTDFMRLMPNLKVCEACHEYYATKQLHARRMNGKIFLCDKCCGNNGNYKDLKDVKVIRNINTELLTLEYYK
jgi:predicted SprT family Zn-dependent metalloprotease